MERRPPEPSSARSRWRFDGSWTSAAFAARTTAAAQLSLLAAWSLGLKHTHWAAMTVWLTAQPTRGLLLDKSVLRVVGTLVGAAVGFGLLWGVGAAGTKMFKEDAMGGGDIKMMAMVGAFVGWQGVLLTVFLGALLGTLVFVPLSLVGKKRLVPFGVFLSLGAAATWLAGAAVIAWYKNFVLVP